MNIKKTAIKAAKDAGDVLLELSKGKIIYQMKNKHDILAEADLKSEKIIIDQVKKNFPDHSIISEEDGETMQNSEYIWVIDPVDGTINFSRDLAEYCISIAVEHKGKLILGLIYKPYTNKMYIAEAGKGAFLNDKKIKVSDETDLINMLLATDSSATPEIRQKNYNILASICNEVRHIRIFGSGALHLAKVAAGKLDIYYKVKFNYWDYAAGTLLIKEAGGVVTDLEGNEITKTSKSILATNGKKHEAILDKIRSV